MTSGYLRGSNNLLAGASAQGGFTIEESLRFNASQSSYLSRTPASASNRKTWTWSGWVKRGNVASEQSVFSADTSNRDNIVFTSDNKLWVYFFSTSNGQVKTTQVFRDPSAWYYVHVAVDTTQATASNRVKIYINGEVVTSFDTASYPSLNYDGKVNSSVIHAVGKDTSGTAYFDGYLTEVNFIDGQALDPSSFGEFDSVTGVWKPAKYTGTYGTNGFYLPMQLDNTVEGFNTVTYIGTQNPQKISGVGFSPDLVWIKSRNNAQNHTLYDSVRGATKYLMSNSTNAEATDAQTLTSFDTDGFSMGTSFPNDLNYTYVAWCWDAGSSTVSNTDGSITSSVRANPTYGFSVVTYTGTGSNATVGHGLGAAPAMVIVKDRSNVEQWAVYHKNLTSASYVLYLESTGGESIGASWNSTAPTSTVFPIGGGSVTNQTSHTYVAYCFSEVAGYSKFGSYTGTGSAGLNITTGFKPAFVMIKRTDATNNWVMVDATRDGLPVAGKTLYANAANSETDFDRLSFTDTGFTLIQGGSGWLDQNASGGTYIYMAFADTREYAYWLDDSGNNNDWQPNGGITTESTVTDTPTPYADGGNYAVLNPLDKNSNLTLSNGNLDFVPANTSDLYSGRSTFQIPSTGKWIWQVTNTNSAYMITAGLIDGATPLLGQQTVSCASMTVGSIGTFFSTTQWMNTTTSWSVTNVGNGDTLVIAYDADAGKIWFGRVASNGSTVSWYNTSGTADPSTGTDPRASGITAGNWFAGVGAYYTPSGASINYGQRPFAFTNTPSGFLPLHTGNLPDSAIVDGSQYFNAVVYTGNSPSSQTIAVGFQPDFVWQKSRAQTYNHTLYDSVRGATKELYSNTTGAEVTDSNGLTAFTSNGFTVGSDGELNDPTGTHVAWNWKANGAGVSNTDGSITSTVSANPTAGFSIVTYTGNGSTGTVGHGLGVAPQMMIIKVRNLLVILGLFIINIWVQVQKV
jgi:hypothetical protein